jgi:Phosphotransferase system, mannose/fructose/N-acetylgalactosamine-specific component IIB
MIKQMRIDNRLIHGEIVALWIPSLGADTLVIADTAYASNQIMKMSALLAKPKNCDFEIRTVEDAISFLNDPANDKRKILVICGTTDNALALVKNCDGIQDVNVGGLTHAEGTKQVSMRVYLNENDVENLKEIDSLGKTIFQQTRPDEKAMSFNEMLGKIK